MDKNKFSFKVFEILYNNKENVSEAVEKITELTFKLLSENETSLRRQFNEKEKEKENKQRQLREKQEYYRNLINTLKNKNTDVDSYESLDSESDNSLKEYAGNQSNNNLKTSEEKYEEEELKKDDTSFEENKILETKAKQSYIKKLIEEEKFLKELNPEQYVKFDDTHDKDKNSNTKDTLTTVQLLKLLKLLKDDDKSDHNIKNYDKESDEFFKRIDLKNKLFKKSMAKYGEVGKITRSCI